MKKTVLVIACGALAKEIVELQRLNGWTHIKIQCLPAELHNRPEKIPGAVRAQIEAQRDHFEHIFVSYADCGTGGMLTVAEERLIELAKQHGKDVSVHLYGQEVNEETYAITKADLLLKGEGGDAENFVLNSTLSQDGFPSRGFDFMLSNPPYGKSWKNDLERMGGKKDMRDSRFMIEHAGDPEYSLITHSSDGQTLFLANMQSGCPAGSRTWSN